MSIKLNTVTLMAFYVPFNNNFDLFKETLQAMSISMSKVKFYENVLVTTKEINNKFGNDLNSVGITCHILDSNIESINDYSKYMVYRLYECFNSEYILTIQHDGYVINPYSWKEEFLEYDYIGAPWPIRDNAYISPFNEHIRVGNGGFSLRSRKLTELPLKADIQFDCTSGDFYKHFNANNFNEDGCIAVHNRHIYEKNGCRFAPVELAASFSQELNVPENFGILPFGFHKFMPGGFSV